MPSTATIWRKSTAQIRNACLQKQMVCAFCQEGTYSRYRSMRSDHPVEAFEQKARSADRQARVGGDRLSCLNATRARPWLSSTRPCRACIGSVRSTMLGCDNSMMLVWRRAAPRAKSLLLPAETRLSPGLLLGTNGKLIASSGAGYKSRKMCLATIALVKKAADAEVAAWALPESGSQRCPNSTTRATGSPPLPAPRSAGRARPARRQRRRPRSAAGCAGGNSRPRPRP